MVFPPRCLRTVTGLLALSLIAGCGAERTPPSFATVRDSAGITIVENTTGRWDAEEAWRLSTDPVLTIGVADGPPNYTLYRVSGALRLATGEIVVANRGTHELRFYDTSGTFLRAVGGEGHGPGEYEGLSGVWRLGTDSLLARDLAFGASVLAMDGTFGRSLRLEGTAIRGSPYLLGPFADGSLFAQVRPIHRGDQGSEGLRRDSFVYARYSATGDAADSLVSRPGDEISTSRLGTTIMIGPPPFGRAAVTALDGDRWYYGSSDRYEIEVYSPDGRLLRLIRRAVENRPITNDVVRAFREEVAARESSDKDFMRFLLELAFPATMPAYDALLVDDERHLWVGEPFRWLSYSLAGDERRWDVFDRDGVFLGTVTHPTEFTPTQIGADYVLGTWRDDDGVVQVRMYRLIKTRRTLQ